MQLGIRDAGFSLFIISFGTIISICSHIACMVISHFMNMTIFSSSFFFPDCSFSPAFSAPSLTTYSCPFHPIITPPLNQHKSFYLCPNTELQTLSFFRIYSKAS